MKSMIFFYCINKALLMYSLCILFPNICHGPLKLVFIADHIYGMGADLGRFGFLLVLGILICRLKTVSMSFKNIATEVSRDKYAVKKYMNMYETLINYVEEIDTPIKFTV
ncbi:hypothetical protein B5X24_HaOG200883 [Helicoverpa armigera]|uniref:Uncharacterized protein n=1 Tax=Helicoverpa armigera TaxID=29058 RepID=A0A2W1BF19_HELAM|nr:hypothetical protein B5X24_HaOG200883 [Helicoverpa armigera]